MTHKPPFMQFFGRALAVSGIALLCFSSAAQAGFEWRGPLEPPVRKSAPAPVQDDMSGLEPVMSWDGVSAAPAPVEAAPVSPALAPFAATSPAPVTTAAVSDDIVAGFGRDLPLVIALQQVAPAGHQFSFAPGVNPGAMVSWEGGKPWQAVMNDMLAPQGLGFQQQGNVIVVGPFRTDDAVLSPQATAAAAQMSSMPQEDMGAPLSLTAPQEAPMAEAPAVSTTAAPSSAEPVTIRRSRPVDSRTAGEAASAASVMSYPPETTGSQPVPITSLPPSATQAPVSVAPADLAAPPPMQTAMMSPAPTAETAPTPLLAKPAVAQEPAQQTAATPQKAGAPWTGAAGATLRDTLKNWSEAANVELYWSIDYDYKLKGDVNYAGAYDEAVGKLLDQFAAVRPQPYGQLHQSKDGPRVLVVKSYDLTP
jgi:hypothetical protein